MFERQNFVQLFNSKKVKKRGKLNKKMANGDTKTGFFSKSNDLKNRIIFTVLLLSVYRFGTYVPLPGIDPQALQTLMDYHYLLACF